MISDNTKIGVLMVGLGVLFLFLGIILFFDSGLLAIGNILFLAGIPFIIGFSRTLQFLNPARQGKTRGIVCFWLGVFLVLWRWPMIGMVIEIVGMVEIFGTFLPIVLNFLRSVPYVGTVLQLPVVDRAVNFLAGAGKRQARPPV